MNRNTHSWCWGFCLCMASVFAYLVIPIISGSGCHQAAAAPLAEDGFPPQTYGGNDPLLDSFSEACPGFQLDQLQEQVLSQELGIQVGEDAAAVWRSISDGEEYRLFVDGSDSGETLLKVRGFRCAFPSTEETTSPHDENLLLIGRLAVEYGEFIHGNSGQSVEVISLLWLASVTDGESNVDGIIQFPLGIVSDSSAAKSFMSQLNHELSLGFGGVPTDCVPLCTCECDAARDSAFMAATIGFDLCVLAALAAAFWVNAGSCLLTCSPYLAAPALYVACWVGCCVGAEFRALTLALAGCLATFAAVRQGALVWHGNCVLRCWINGG